MAMPKLNPEGVIQRQEPDKSLSRLRRNEIEVGSL